MFDGSVGSLSKPPADCMQCREREPKRGNPGSLRTVMKEGMTRLQSCGASLKFANIARVAENIDHMSYSTVPFDHGDYATLHLCHIFWLLARCAITSFLK